MRNHLGYQPFYRRNLPHIQPPGATFFITTRLHGSLPIEVILRLRDESERRLQIIEATADPAEKTELLYREERRYFGRFDDWLDAAATGPDWLRDPPIAELVCDVLHNRDTMTYELLAYCVMPNHLHVVLTPLRRDAESYHSLSRIMHTIKSYTAHKANVMLVRKGAFWQGESYDHYVRDADELQRIVYYVLWNPVKAGLVAEWTDWPWTYWKYAPAM